MVWSFGVVNVLDFLEGLKNEGGQNAVNMANQIEKLKSVLECICTYVQLSHCDLKFFDDVMSEARQEVENLLRPILDDVDNNVGYTDGPILIAEHSKLENLRDLRTLVLSYSKETEDIFIRFPNLQSLVFDLKESWDYLKEQYWFPKLDHLTELDYLRANFESSNANDSGASLATNWSWDFYFPSNLKTLVLYDFPLALDSISTIARLPNLEELFLRRTIMQGGMKHEGGRHL
ncbi:hypothetical protein CQW23_31363 [Capsicum baccatum]|uniref:Uncharacterized protein n=1 Tax=Capsicum baccatum TaxID=33114 RepID=A0A2G2V7Q8_CAPBA|nr:hypothetical protein CQW23_31363 [Capsicum baccatum]